MSTRTKVVRPSPTPAFMQPMQPDAELAAIVGETPQMRTEITRLVWKYIQRHALQDTSERRMINADAKLQRVLNGQARVSMFEMTALVNQHLTPATAAQTNGDAMPAATKPRTRKKKTPSTNGKGVTHAVEEAKAAVTPVPPHEPMPRPRQIMLRVGDMVPRPGLNTRRHFEQAELEELAESIRVNGLVQPIVLHETGERVKHVLAGERRWRAATLLGPDFEISCTIAEYSAARIVEVMLLENLHRRDLRPTEEAEGFARALTLPGLTQDELGRRIGKSQGYIANRLRLRELPDAVRELVDDDTLQFSWVRDSLMPFLRIPAEKRDELFTRVAVDVRATAEDDYEPLNAEMLRHIVADIAIELSRPLNAAGRFHRDPEPAFDARAHTKCTCNAPKYRYGHQDGGLRCFDNDWWDDAQSAALERKRAKEKAEKAEAQAAADGAASRVRTMSADEFRREYNYRSEFGNEPLDVRELAETSFIVVRHPHGSAEVQCVDEDALRRARKPVAAAEREAYERLREELVAEETAAVSKMKVDADVLRALMHHRLDSGRLLDICRHHGIDVGKQGDVYERLESLSDADTELLAKVITLRGRADLLGWQDPLRDKAKNAAARKFRPGVTALKKRVLEQASAPA